MEVGDVIEFRVGLADLGVGEIMAVDHDSERVIVRDIDDGSTWSGNMDDTCTPD